MNHCNSRYFTADLVRQALDEVPSRIPPEEDEAEAELYGHPPDRVPPDHVSRVSREDEAEKKEDQDTPGADQPQLV